MKSLMVFFIIAGGLLAYAQDTINVSVETVQVYTNVTDLTGRFVTGLKAEQFRVFEDGKEQKVDAFTSDDSPVSVGILFDVNGAMGDNFPLAKQGALMFLKAGNLNNDYFVLEFNDKPQISEDFTHDLSVLERHDQVLHRSKASGAIDAVNLGLEKLRTATNPRKVLLIFTAGGLSKNEHKVAQVRNLARQIDVQILGVTMSSNVPCDGNPLSVAICGAHELDEGFDSGLNIIESVGGDGFASDSGPDFVNICRRLAVGIRNQYIVGYQSTNPVHDGKYRHLQVKLNLKDVPDLIVHTRAGYYAAGSEGGIQ